MLHVGGNLRKGREDEGALRDARVWYLEVRCIHNPVAVEQDIHVHCPWPVANGAHASQPALHLLDKSQQLRRDPGRSENPQTKLRKDGCAVYPQGSVW